jgi:hypothetical protein
LSVAYTVQEIVVLLAELGLDHAQAETAATDPAITWDETAVKNCIAFLNESTADRPAAVLWMRLKQHHVPIPRTVKPDLRLLTDAGPFLCPVCKEDFAVCQGMHGWAAKYRGMAPAAIFRDGRPVRPRRSRVQNGDVSRTDGEGED